MDQENVPVAGKTAGKTRADWVLAALGALAEGGVEAVKVERLAKALGVSKGSFYWHFKDRSDLLLALLDLWDTEFTQELIDRAASQPTPAARLRQVAREALERTMYGVDSARAEAAMQAWAGQDEQAAARLRLVEQARVGYLTGELIAAGLSAAGAGAMAKALYLSLLGLYAARAYNPTLADDRVFLDLVDLVLAEADGS